MSRRQSPLTARVTPHARRSPLMLAAGVILVVASALVCAGIYSRLSTTQEVIAIAAPVARGQQIQRTDLIAVQVGFDPLLTPVPASQIPQIVGKYAAFDLVPGGFLTPASVGDHLFPTHGMAEVGVALSAGEYPDDRLKPGDSVLLVSVPERTDSSQPASYPGTLVTITASQSTAAIIVTVMVDSASAPVVAALSASDKLALVLAERER